MTSGNGQTITFEAKLPNPAIITCKTPILLSFVLKRAPGSVDIVQVKSIQITLLTITSTQLCGTLNEIKSSLQVLDRSKLTMTLPAGEEELFIDPADQPAVGSYENVSTIIPGP